MMIRSLTALAAISAAAMSLASGAQASTTIYNATGGVENGGDSFKSAGRALLDEVQNTTAATLTSVTLNVLATKADLGSFDVVLTQVNGNGTPKGSSAVVIATVSDKKLTTAFKLITVRPASPVALLASTKYYVGIAYAAGGPSSVVLGNTVDPSVLARASVVAGGFYYNNGGVQANAGGPYEIRVATAPTGP